MCDFELARTTTRVAHANLRKIAIDWQKALCVDVLPISDDWEPYSDEFYVMVRTVERSPRGHVAVLEVAWPQAGTTPEHYHPKCKEVTIVTKGHVTVFFEPEPESGLVDYEDLGPGDMYTIEPGVRHATSFHAGCAYRIVYHPPMPHSAQVSEDQGDQ